MAPSPSDRHSKLRAVSEGHMRAWSKMKARWQRCRMHDGDISKLQSLGGPDEDERHPLPRLQAAGKHQASAAPIEDAVGRAGPIRQQPARGREIHIAAGLVFGP